MRWSQARRRVSGAPALWSWPKQAQLWLWPRAAWINWSLSPPKSPPPAAAPGRLRWTWPAKTPSKPGAKAVIAEFGKVEILVNNAGVTRDTLMLRMKRSDWEDVLTTNLTGAFLLTQACASSMLKARWGRVINITSVVGQTGAAGQANYAASKAGLIGLTKSLARELASRGITVNAIAPGFIQTAMTDALSEEQKSGILAQVPLGRYGTDTDIAAAVLFLASEGASYITGHTLDVNGGMFMS